MKIISVTMEGFLSYRAETRFEMNSIVLASVTGPNGHGKSTIEHAISWALFEDTRLDNDKDSVVNDYEDTARVTVEFESRDGTLCRVIRERRYNSGTTLRFQHYDDEENDWFNAGGRIIKDTQRIIIETLGIDSAAFHSLSVLKQSAATNGSDFTGAKPNQRRAILMSLLPELSVWGDINETAQSSLTELKRELESKRSSLQYVIDDRDRNSERLSELETEAANSESRDKLIKDMEAIDADIERLVSIIDAEQDGGEDLRAKLSELAAERRAHNVEITARMNEVNRKLEEYEVLSGSVDRAKDQLEETQDDLEEKKEDLENAREEYETASSEVEDLKTRSDESQKLVQDLRIKASAISARIEEAKERRKALSVQHDHGSGKCLVCSSPIDIEKIDELLDGVENEIEQAQDEQDALDTDMEKAEAAYSRIKRKHERTSKIISSASTRITRLEQSISSCEEDIELHKKKVSDLTSRLKGYKLSSLKKQVKDLKAQLWDESEEETKLGEQIDELSSEHPRSRELKESRERRDRLRNAVSDMDKRDANIESLKKEIEDQGQSIDSTKKEVDKLIEDIDVLSWNVDATGQKGIPSVLIGEILDELETEQNGILERVFGMDAMKIEYRQEKELKNQSTEETLDIIITSPDAFERPFEALSAGEKVRITVSNLGAMGRVFNRRFSVPVVQTLFLDEPFGPIDRDSISAFIAILQDMVDQGIVQNVLVVTHDQNVIDSLPQQVRVSKGASSNYGSVIEVL